MTAESDALLTEPHQLAALAAELRGHLEFLGDARVNALPLVARRLTSGVAAATRETPPLPIEVRAATEIAEPNRARPSLEQVRAELGECTRCKLHRGRTKLVFGVGNPEAEIAFVGEGPGEDEDKQGEPFVGRAGQLLTRIIEDGMGLARRDVYIMNIVKCRPPQNREPEREEIATCLPFLQQQIAAIAPRVIVTLGRPSTSTLLGHPVSITAVRGKWHEYRGIPMMPTYHPAFVLRRYTPEVRRQVWEDMKEVLRASGEPHRNHAADKISIDLVHRSPDSPKRRFRDSSMKLCLVGGGGSRAPLFVQALARRATRLPVDELALFDADPRRLRVLGGLAAALARAEHASFQVTLASSLEEAIDGAKFVITSIRAGGDAARAHDEQTARSLGVLGQETVGAAGFAMAMRNIPALVTIADATARLAADAWTLHFTNPAGLIAQVLRDGGHVRQIGICDTPTDLVRRTAAFAQVAPTSVRADVIGLNHLSWVERFATNDGHDLLPDLLGDPRFVTEVAQPFEADLVAGLGLLPTEYLHYYVHRDEALRRQLAGARPRGSFLEDLNVRLLQDLTSVDPSGAFTDTGPRALEVYRGYCAARDASYREELGRDGETTPPGETSEGYAGIALDLIEGIHGDTGATSVASVPNGSALPGLDADDVIEVTVKVGSGGPVPDRRPGALPPEVAALIQSVKAYERLASRAIRGHDERLACRALAAHPLIGSYPIAATLANEFMARYGS